MSDGLRLALTTLTVLRVRGPTRLDRRTAGAAMSLAPLVGLLLGLAAAAVLAGAQARTAEPLLPAALAVAALAALTRGLHLDGLADTADGLGSYLPADRAREVMKAPDVGALGLAAVALTLLVQVAALAACASGGHGPLAVVLAAVLARTAVAAACTARLPAAAPDGLGALVAGTVRVAVPLGWAALALLAAGLVDGPAVVAAGLGALLVAGLLLRHAVRRLGGISGDVLGALVEVTTTLVLVGVALA